MKRKKSILLSIALSIILIVTSLFTAYAVTNPTIHADDVSVNAGNMVKIPIIISNNNGLAGAKLKFDYDDTKLTPISVEAGEIFTSGLQDNIEGDSQPGSFNVYWASSTGDNISSNGILFYLNFDIVASATDSTSIGISYDQADTFDEDFEDVKLDCQSVEVNITNESLKDLPIIDVSVSGELSVGESSYLTFHALNVKKPTIINARINYESSAFDIYNLKGEANSVTVDQGTGSTFSFFVTPEDNDTDVLIFELVANRNASKKQVIEFSSDNALITKAVEINVKSGIEAVSPIVSITYQSFVEKGNTVSVPVKISNNSGIMGYRLKFEYNPSDLEIISVTSGESFKGSLYDSIGNEDGKFDVVWNSTSMNSNSGILLYLNFRAVSNNVDKAIHSRINVSYDQNDTFDEEYNDVKLECRNGVVLICPQHIYTSSVTEPKCEEPGYTYYECKYCRFGYYDYIQSIGHYYVYQKDGSSATVKSFDMEYRCKDCGKVYNTNGDEVKLSYTDQYFNTKPTRDNLTIQLLDVNNDGFINAKDMAMIYHAVKSK